MQLHAISRSEIPSLLCHLFLFLQMYTSFSSAQPRVKLTNGSPIIGKEGVAPTTKKPVVEFLGIPYAEPPIKKLRFKKPVPKSPWSRDHYATKMPNACMQTADTYFGNFSGSTMWNPNVDISEDCLYLNVWVPGQLDLTRKRQVMVWVYGGGFWSGCASLKVYDGKILSTEEDIILVSMNYRVSVFGFLYLDKDKSPGNMGLWDQQLSIKWVKENIAQFGGDENNVMVFGESAGGASVTMQVVTPHNRGLFRRAAIQSGSVTAPWALEEAETLRRRAFRMGESMHCNAGKVNNESSWNLEKLHDCMMAASADTLRENEWAVTGEFADFPWTPMVDGDFFVEHPLHSLKRGAFINTELLAGSNREESIFFIVYQLQKIFHQSRFFEESDWVFNDTQWREGAIGIMPKRFARNSFVRNAILFEYMNWDLPVTPHQRQMSFDKMMGDYLFLCNVNEFAQYFSQHGGKVYYYYFTHRATAQTWPAWMGVLHGYEINFIFGEPLNTEEFSYTEEERELARRFMRYWANFARTGNPMENPDGSWQPGTWPRYHKDSMEYHELSVTNSVTKDGIGRGPRRRQCAFWKEYIPKLYTATSDYSDAMVKWKQEFDRWQNDYIVDWQHHFEQYKKYQSYRRQDSCGAG